MEFALQMQHVVYLFTFESDGKKIDSSMCFPASIVSDAAIAFIRNYILKLNGSKVYVTDVRHCVITTPINNLN